MIDELYSENLVDSPDDIEQVIEGGEDRAYESGRENENEDQKSDEDKNKENKDDKDTGTKVKRKLGPRMVLNAQRLNGPRGIGVMESFFSDMKLHGKGREREDLEAVMKRMEHWAHRLAPRLQFDDCLKKIEKLGSKKEVANRVKRIRLDLDLDDDVVRDDGAENAPDSPPPPPDDPFDQLIASTVAAPPNATMTAEQREQMLRNRLLAEERRAARIKKAQEMKLKFQERLVNSQTVNSQSVDLPEEAVEARPDNENVEMHSRTNADLNERSLDPLKEQSEEKDSLEDTEFEGMVVEDHTEMFFEKEVESCEVSENKVSSSFHESQTAFEEVQPALETPQS